MKSRIKWVQGASFVYTDTWTSMGQEQEAEVRRRIFAGYQVNEALLALARTRAPDAVTIADIAVHAGANRSSCYQRYSAKGTLLAQDGDVAVATPYDNAVLIMPTRNPRKGETAVRIGRFVS